MGIRRDVTGQRFARLTAISHVGSAKSGQSLWLCKCDCGAETTTTLGNLTSRVTRSCGCLKREHPGSKPRHGHARKNKMTDEYGIWRAMKSRCHYPKSINYLYYGARGIIVCDDWRNSFEAFLRDVGPRPSPKHTLERTDNDGNYDPQNVRWALPIEQGRNKRTAKLVSVRGETLSIADAVRRFSKRSKGTVGSRLARGWDIERALFT
jgi:hypothetical protein